ncbi:type ISP restriction/modification enzyme [Mesorhizobium sp. M0633]|uniref:type ISP restriction/modification enzyme n=1 Tax=Mesorhizobium sp. M0633 TaxID=2956977 RepID=UPI00333C1FF1
MAEALAHEAQAANDAKAKSAFTVVMGNPPYSVKSYNNGNWILALCEDYKRNVRQEESQIQGLSNDYIKFIRLSQYYIGKSSAGIVGLITGHGYLLGTQPRDLRHSLFNEFSRLIGTDLNGSLRRDSVDGIDEPIFEIITGVAIGLFSRLSIPNEGALASYQSIEGTFEQKESWMRSATIEELKRHAVHPTAPNYFFWRRGGLESEFEVFADLPTIFGTGDRANDKEKYWSTGFATQQDDFAVAFSEDELFGRMHDLSISSSRKQISNEFRMCSTNQWNYSDAVKYARGTSWKGDISLVAFRPFDYRYSIVNRSVMTILKEKVQGNFDIDNIALLTSRLVNDSKFAHVFLSTRRTDKIFLSSKSSTNTYTLPLWLKPSAGETYRRPNVNGKYAVAFAATVDLLYEDGMQRRQQGSLSAAVWDGRGDLDKTFGPRDLFDWIYTVLHSTGYRTRYAEFLKSDFPRIPSPKDRDTFAALVPLGRALVALHLLKPDEAPALQNPEIRFAGHGEAHIEKGFPQYTNGKVMINASCWFEDVPRETWDFYVGGYKVCEKWLKDRAAKGGKNPSAGHILTDDDILHYRRVVTALTETRLTMAEIDRVIDVHGGWPKAFYIPPPPPPTVEEIIQADESRELEFKSTFQWDVRERKQNKDLQKSVLKTLVAFMNSGGGTLVIGVTDDKEIHGLDDDLSITKGSLDVFEQTLLNVFSSAIGVAYAQHIVMRFADAPGGKKVCVVDVKASQEPAFLEFQGKHEFFIRRGNASVSLNPSEQHTYTRQRFAKA